MNPVLSSPLRRWLEGKPDWLAQCVSQPLHDTHEHLQTEQERLEQSPNPLYLLSHYLPTDLVAAGVPEHLIQNIYRSRVDGRLAAWQDDFRQIEPYWKLVSCSGYARAVLRSLDCVYGQPEFSLAAFEAAGAWLEANRSPGICATMLDRAGILTTQTNSFDDGAHGRLPVRRIAEPDRFLHDFYVDVFLHPEYWPVAEQEKRIEIRDTQSWLELITRYFQEDAASCIAVKCAIAYVCDLHFPDSSEADADRAIKAAQPLRGVEILDKSPLLPFWGWAMRRVLELAQAANLPVKFHTGHYSGPFTEPLGRMAKNLIHLEPLIQEFPEVRFVLLHHAYPYGEAAVTLAKSYPNAFVDQTWLWGMNPAAGVRYLKEFLLGAPRNKIFLFGGDCYRLESSIGHADLARQGLGVALWEMVQEGWIDADEALGLARACCFDNQEAVFPGLASLRMSLETPR